MQLTVDREQLIAALTEKRDEIAATAQSAVDQAQEALDAAQPTGSVSGWLREIADLVDSEVVTVSRPQRSYEGWFSVEYADDVTEDGPEYPAFPESNPRKIHECLARLTQAQAALAEATKPFDASLKILNMSTDEKVDVVGGNYTHLLES